MQALRAWAGLELRHLLALDAVAEQGSFHRAAAHLGYSQSAISQQIAALERIVGQQLIERLGGSRPVRLTAAGAVLLEHGRALFGQVAAAYDDVGAAAQEQAGPLRVGAFQSVGTHVLPALLARLERSGSRLRIELTHAMSDDELLAALADGELDVTFAMLPLPEGPYEIADAFADPFVVLAGAGSELAARGGPVTIAELAGLPLVTAQRCRTLHRVEAQLRERGLAPRIVHRSDDNAVIRGLVAEGMGVALVPRLSAGEPDADVHVLPVADDLPPRRVVLAWRGDGRAAARTAFVDEVARTCRELGLLAAQRPRAA